MSKTPNISNAEWKVMKVLWARSPQTSADVIEALAPTESWHPNTTKTLITRLQRKGAVAVDKRKDPYQDRAAVSETQAVQYESRSFLDRVFNGQVKPLLVHFVEKQKVSADDIKELKEILRRKAS